MARNHREGEIMASKRMFSMQIVDSDAFLDMPSSTQNLYFHLNMRADDEGFINNPKKIMRMIGASQDDMNVLITKRFILVFESGVIVVKHWKMHNYIRQDRLKETAHIEEKKLLTIKENGAYSMRQPNVCQLSGKCQTNVSIDKIRLDKNRLDKNSINTSYPTSDESDVLSYETELAEQLAKIILEYDPEARVPKSFKTWAKSIDRMMRIDKRTPEQILWLFRWAQNDEFWNPNIRSPDKLRKQWDKLLFKAKQERKPKKGSLEDRLSDTFTAVEAYERMKNERTNT